MTDVQVITQGVKVGKSESELLKKLNIRPFTYGLKCINVYDNGSVYSAEVLKLTEDEIQTKLQRGFGTFTAISLGAGIANEASVPHMLVGSFKSLVSMALDAEYSFKEGDRLMAIARDPSAFMAAAATE